MSTKIMHAIGSTKGFLNFFHGGMKDNHYIIGMKLQEISNDPGTYIFHCPGCNMLHQVPTLRKGSPNWTFNGSLQRPTFSPSLLIRFPHFDGSKDVNLVCHSFVKEGKIQYLSDCTHELAGETVEIPEVETFLN